MSVINQGILKMSPSGIGTLNHTKAMLGLLLQVLTYETTVSNIKRDSLLAGLGRGLVGMEKLEGMTTGERYESYFRYYIFVCLCLEDSTFVNELAQLDTPSSTMRRLLEDCRQELDSLLGEMEDSGEVTKKTMDRMCMNYPFWFTDTSEESEENVTRQEIERQNGLINQYQATIFGLFKNETIRAEWICHYQGNVWQGVLGKVHNLVNGLLIACDVLLVKSANLDGNRDNSTIEEGSLNMLVPIFELWKKITEDTNLLNEGREYLLALIKLHGDMRFQIK